MIRATRLASFAVILAAGAIALWAARADLDWFERHVAPSYCVAAGPTWPWHAARLAGLAVAVVLAVVVRPRIGRVPLSVIPAVVLGIGAGELILRRAHWDDVHDGREMPAMRSDARLGWVPAPLQTTPYATDAWGNRGPAVNPAAPTLIVAGESIAFGWRLDWDQTFAAQAGRELGLAVVNVSVPAYGTDQAYLRLVDALSRLAKPEVVVFVFVPRQIRRSLSPARPHLVLEGGHLVTEPAATGLRAWRLARLFTDEPYHGDAAVEVTRAVLVAAADAARARGARPLFLLTNYGPACPDSAVLRELLDGLPVVRVDLGPEDVLDSEDPHPNPRAATKIAAALVTALR